MRRQHRIQYSWRSIRCINMGRRRNGLIVVMVQSVIPEIETGLPAHHCLKLIRKHDSTAILKDDWMKTEKKKND
jgi:hypothetical protein